MRFNFLGGPGAGKSTTSAMVFALMKKELFSVELVNEYVKSWAYAKQPVDFYDQFYIQAKQIHYEYRFLKNGVKNIITDAPVALSYVYAPPSLRETLQHVSDTYDRDFASFNIFLVRGDKPYVPLGRYHDKERALEIDKRIEDIVPNLHFVNYGDIDSIMLMVREMATR